MKRKVAEIILILLFYLIQVTFGNAIGIGGITPNLLIILPVLFGFFIPLAMIMASDFVFEFLSYIGNFLLHNRLNVDFFLRRFIMPEVVYTLVVALVLYYPLMKFDSILDIQWKKRKKGILDEGSI